MEGQRITAEELVVELQGDLKALAEKMAVAINNAKLGRIIADSEEPVRDAHAVFRAYPGRPIVRYVIMAQTR